MPEISSLQDANARINALFEVKSGGSPALLDDYARIAWYLSNTDATQPNFRTGMTEVSKGLWGVYRDYHDRFGGRMRNLFSTAIREVAGRYGWAYDSDDSVVLVFAVKGNQYMDWVRKGVLFKDMMDVKHGEHSHTFQWLAIAHDATNIHLAHPACFLYKNTDQVKRRGGAKLILPKEKHADGRQGLSDKFDLFAWIADCFPVSMAHSGQDPAGESIFSDRFRCPQAVTRYLVDEAPEDHFVGNYLRFRYRKRQWFPNNSVNYDNISGTSSKGVGMIKHKDVNNWIPVEGDPQPIGGFKKAARRAFYTEKELQERKFIKVRFHNVNGFLTDPGKP